MFGKNDITFCSNEECLRTDCKRHPSRVPVGIPVSMFIGMQSDGKDCRYYWPEGGKESGGVSHTDRESWSEKG